MLGIKKLITTCLVGVAIMAMTKTSSASSYIPPPGQPWGEFRWSQDTSNFADFCNAFACDASVGGNSFFLDTPPWTFTATDSSSSLIVQDVFASGDQFEVFDFGVSIGTTSLKDVGSSCINDPTVCFIDPNVSHGIFALAPGLHSFTIEAIVSPFFSGVGYFCIDSGHGECGVPLDGGHEVPEPMSMLLLGLGLAGAFLWVKRPQLSKIRVLIARKRERR